jgi:hypothetical protein
MTMIEVESSNSSNDFLVSNANKSKKIKEVIHEIAKETFQTPLTMAVTNIVFTPHYPLKIFLFIFVLVSTGLASYTVIQSVMAYFNFDVTTTSRTLYETPTLFPKVTFCNVNKYTTEYGVNLAGLKKNVDNLSNEDKKKLGHDLSDILLQCKFNQYTCSASDFTWSFDESYGNCYTFNSGFDSDGNETSLKQSNIAYPLYGLQLGVYVNFYENLLNNPFAYKGQGAVVRIGNSSYSTYYGDGGLFISPGLNTFVAVEREFKSILPQPYSNCEAESNSELYNLILKSKYAYTQQLCFVQCMQRFFINKYNCSLSFLISLYSNVSVCDVGTISFSDMHSVEESKFYSETCLPLCPLECNQTLYKSSISFNRLYKSQYLTFIKKNSKLSSDFINRSIDSSTAEQSFVSVNVFYESLSYKESTESPQLDMITLLGAIGGNLGLFLGASMFTLSEMVEVAIALFISLKNINKTRQSFK